MWDANSGYVGLRTRVDAQYSYSQTGTDIMTLDALGRDVKKRLVLPGVQYPNVPQVNKEEDVAEGVCMAYAMSIQRLMTWIPDLEVAASDPSIGPAMSDQRVTWIEQVLNRDRMHYKYLFRWVFGDEIRRYREIARGIVDFPQLYPAALYSALEAAAVPRARRLRFDPPEEVGSEAEQEELL